MHSKFYRDKDNDIDEFLAQFDEADDPDASLSGSSNTAKGRGGASVPRTPLSSEPDEAPDELSSMFERAGVSLSDDFDRIRSKNPEAYEKINQEFDLISSNFEKSASAPLSAADILEESTAQGQGQSEAAARTAAAGVSGGRMARHTSKRKSASTGAAGDDSPRTDDPWEAIQAKDDFWNTAGGSGSGGEPPRTGNDGGDTMKKGKKKRKKGKFNKKRIFKVLVAMFMACVVLGCAMVGYIVLTTEPIDPDNIYERLTQNSVIYDDEGNVIDNLGSDLRTNVSYSQLPENLVNAVVSIEDKTFWQHHGFNFVRIFGAIIEGVTKGESISGTSTITQQLARNLYLADTKSQRSMTRKLKEAYYAVQLEQSMDKSEIVEAYLNTIYLGGSSYGVQAASQSYFGKNVEELNLAECALLASIPKNPNRYSPVKRAYDDVNTEGLDILYQDDATGEVAWYDNRFMDRMHLVLKFMLEQKKISQAEYDEAMAFDIRSSINPPRDAGSSISSYFIDYVVRQVKEDLMENNKWSEEDALQNIYNSGLQIHTTMNLKMQQIVETAFEDNANLPKVNSRELNLDGSGNILDARNRIVLYKWTSLFDGNGTFVLAPDEYQKNGDGSLTLLAGKRLTFPKTSVNGEVDYNVEFKSMYYWDDSNVFKTRNGGVVNMPNQYNEEKRHYKTKDDDGNLTISADFFQEYPQVCQFTDNGITISSEHYTLRQEVVQPQAAMVIMDQSTGSIKAMVGGRNLKGQKLFNRATSPRQPGSSIKPIAVYGPALQSGLDSSKNGGKSGTIWTAASVITDEAQSTVNGKPWPKNWNNTYSGPVSLRYAVEQSINTVAVHIWNDIGVDTSLKFIKGLGVTSVVEDGDANDMNPAALALGGMTKGISPLEMCAAYSAFPNGGVYTEPIAYTQVTNRKGELLLETSPNTSQAMDPGVAYMITDILRGAVDHGGGSRANFSGQPVAGKTGTTSDKFDAWFCGFTPQYTASLWIGNDVNITLSGGSEVAASLWSKIMRQVCAGLPAGSYTRPANIVSATVDTRTGMLASEYSSLGGTAKSELFIKGTQPTKVGSVNYVTVSICSESGEKATPECPNPVSKTFGNLSDDGTNPPLSEVPKYYCSIHNSDHSAWEVNPNGSTPPSGTDTPTGGGVSDSVFPGGPTGGEGNGTNGGGSGSGTGDSSGGGNGGAPGGSGTGGNSGGTGGNHGGTGSGTGTSGGSGSGGNGGTPPGTGDTFDPTGSNF